MAAKPRGSETVGDAVRSIVALIGVVAVVVIAFTVMKPDERLPDPVDYSGVVEMVRAEYPYPPAVPSPEPDGWRATSVDHSTDAGGHRWRLGFLTDDEAFVGVEQSDGEIQAYLADRLRGFEADGTSMVSGTSWERHRQVESPHDHALLREADGVVTIVRGTESYDALEDFAASLG